MPKNEWAYSGIRNQVENELPVFVTDKKLFFRRDS